MLFCQRRVCNQDTGSERGELDMMVEEPTVVWYIKTVVIKSII